MLPLRARVDQEAMTMKGSSAFPKVPTLQITFQHSDCLISYPEYSLSGRGGLILLQSMYSTVPTHWDVYKMCKYENMKKKKKKTKPIYSKDVFIYIS